MSLSPAATMLADYVVRSFQDTETPTEAQLKERMNTFVPVLQSLGMPTTEGDRAAVLRELLSRLRVSLDVGTSLKEVDVKPWLDARRSTIDPFYWVRYRNYLQREWSPTVLRTFDKVTDEILDLCGKPPGLREARGLETEAESSQVVTAAWRQRTPAPVPHRLHQLKATHSSPVIEDRHVGLTGRRKVEIDVPGTCGERVIDQVGNCRFERVADRSHRLEQSRCNRWSGNALHPAVNGRIATVQDRPATVRRWKRFGSPTAVRYCIRLPGDCAFRSILRGNGNDSICSRSRSS